MGAGDFVVGVSQDNFDSVKQSATIFSTSPWSILECVGGAVL